jgi:hypothetical protein
MKAVLYLWAIIVISLLARLFGHWQPFGGLLMLKIAASEPLNFLERVIVDVRKSK